MIWCVGHDMSVQNIEAYALRQNGYPACGISDMMLLWEKVMQCKPDLILLDISRPGGSSMKLFRQLKENTLTCKIPVVAAVAQNMGENHIQTLNMAAEACLLKPFGLREMVFMIRDILAG